MKYSFLVFTEIPSSDDKGMLIVDNSRMSVSRLIHIRYLLDRMSQAIIDKGLGRDFHQRVTDSSSNKIGFVLKLNHIAKVVGPKPLRNCQAIQ
jgi:hypothetical protein